MIHVGDCLDILPTLPAGSVHTVVTSPPYFGLRSYLDKNDSNKAREIGCEPTPDEFVAAMVRVFREVRRVLRDDGTCWLNLGDSYAGGGQGNGSNGSKQRTNKGSLEPPFGVPDGLKPKDLIGIPWRVAFALQADGWWLRSDIIWAKSNPMPESVRDRPTKSHEYLFLLTKSPRYYFDAEAVKEPQTASGISRAKYPRVGHSKDVYGDGLTNLRNPATDAVSREREQLGNGRNIRSVWTIPTKSFRGAHFATFPPKLVEPCIKAGCPVGGTVLDPFAGAGTTGLVAKQLGRSFVGCELNPDYAAMAEARIAKGA